MNDFQIKKGALPFVRQLRLVAVLIKYMKKYYIYLIIYFSCQIIYSQKYANEEYTFSFNQKGNFELSLNYDADEVGIPKEHFVRPGQPEPIKKLQMNFTNYKVMILLTHHGK